MHRRLMDTTPEEYELTPEERDAIQHLSTLHPRTAPINDTGTIMRINLDGWGIGDISNLSVHTAVTHLGLHDLRDGTDMGPIVHLSQLRVLGLSREWTGCESTTQLNIEHLGSLTRLTSLDISGRVVDGISPLANCQQLVELHIINCRGMGSLDSLLQCRRLSVLTSRWAYMSGTINADQCVHFNAAAGHGPVFDQLARFNSLHRRLQKLMERWSHFSKIEGTNAVTNFIVTKEQRRGEPEREQMRTRV